MTTIRIIDAPHPRAEQEVAESSNVVNSIYTTGRLHRTESIDSRDGIYNIRSRSGAPSAGLRRKSSTTEKLDDDPGLRREGDYKHKQVLGSLTYFDKS